MSLNLALQAIGIGSGYPDTSGAVSVDSGSISPAPRGSVAPVPGGSPLTMALRGHQPAPEPIHPLVQAVIDALGVPVEDWLATPASVKRAILQRALAENHGEPAGK